MKYVEYFLFKLQFYVNKLVRIVFPFMFWWMWVCNPTSAKTTNFKPQLEQYQGPSLLATSTEFPLAKTGVFLGEKGIYYYRKCYKKCYF